jgi:hypothetical protein
MFAVWWNRLAKNMTCLPNPYAVSVKLKENLAPNIDVLRISPLGPLNCHPDRKD